MMFQFREDNPLLCVMYLYTTDWVNTQKVHWLTLQTCDKNGCLLVGCLMSQHHARVFQGRICTDNFTCCHTEIEVADQTFYLTQSQNTDTGSTSPNADPIKPGSWQGSHWSANVKSLVWLDPEKIPAQARFEPGNFLFRGGRLKPLGGQTTQTVKLSYIWLCDWLNDNHVF